MQKQEFEKLIGHDVSIECYERIEIVYMESEKILISKESQISTRRKT